MIKKPRRQQSLYNWIFPRGSDRNITASIDKFVIGKDICNDKDNNIVQINVPRISTKTYFNIAFNIVNKKNLYTDNIKHYLSKYKYLKFTKKNEITKACLKKIARVSASICPKCHHVNCWQCCLSVKNKMNIKSNIIIFCYNCKNMFKTRIIDSNFIGKKYLSFYSIHGFENKKCMQTYGNLYKDFLNYSKWKKKLDKKEYAFNNSMNNNGNKKLFHLYNSLTVDSKKDLKYNPNNLNYCLRVVLEKNERGENNPNDKEIIIPPMIFFLNRKKTMSFFKRMLMIDSTMAVKTRYGSVFSRGGGGKTNIFRTICCNRRHVLSARIVIVPRYQLKPDECILPFSIFSRLGCPKFVLCHRYPTLDLKSMTFHYVKGTWQYPSMAISTSIVGGNNADFDGDCLHVIPAMSLLSQSELLYLLHPRYNMICQQKLRILFDHDERQTIYSLLGLDANEIHDGLYAMAEKEGSQKAFDYFCKLKSICNFMWQTKTINTISCKDFLSIIPIQPLSYIKYRNDFYSKIPNHNGIKEMIESKASRFSFDHAWQLFGEISQDAPVGFLHGMNKGQFIKVARGVRNNLVSEISLFGYTIIKLTHCTKSILIGYDGRVYTTDGVLVALNIKDLK